MAKPYKAHAYINPGPGVLKGMDAVTLNNEAFKLSRAGDDIGAEKLHKEALEIKNQSFGPDSVQAAFSRNMLGETQLKLGKLDEAEQNLKVAVEIRNREEFTGLDAAVTRENLAQVYEAQGRLKDAKAIRSSGGPNSICCGHYNCPGQTFTLSQLKACSRCKSVYYCSTDCQKQDWVKRHKPLCKAAAA